MKYQKETNLLDNTPIQQTKFKTNNLLEINYESRETYDKDNEVRFKTFVLCDYSDAYILVKGSITITNTATQDQPNNSANEKLILKSFAAFTSSISRINNKQVDGAQYIDVVNLKCNSIERNDNCAKASGTLWQFYRDVPAVSGDSPNVNFDVGNTTTKLFNVKVRLADQATDNGIKIVQTMVALKYLSTFWRTLEMLLINYKVNLDLNWSEKFLIVATNEANQGATFQ